MAERPTAPRANGPTAGEGPVERLLTPGTGWRPDPASLPGDRHPDEGTWERLALGELADDERLRLMDHLPGCAECTRVFRALRHLEAGATEFDPGALAGQISRPAEPGLAEAGPTDTGSSWRTPAWIGLAAASLLAAVWIGLPSLRNETGSTAGAGPDAVTAPAAPSSERAGGPAGQSLDLETPQGKLTVDQLAPTSPGPTIFRWVPVAGAVGYRVELLDGRGNPLATWDLEDTGSDWPAEVDPVSGLYYWRVRATLEAGGFVTSELTSFELFGDAADLRD